MKKMLLTTVLTAYCLIFTVNGQSDPKQKGLDAITMDAIKGQLEFLASDWTEGRATGEKGMYLASDYIASMFKVFGIAPAGDPGGMSRFAGMRSARGGGNTAMRETAPRTYFQNFSLIESTGTEPALLTIKKGTKELTFDEGVDFTTSRVLMTTKFEAPIIFVGYGIVDKELGINDFAGVDVKGKIIMRLSGFPGSNDPESPMFKKLAGTGQRTPMEINRSKAVAINGLDIAGIIDVSPGTDIAKNWGLMKDGINISAAETGRGRTNWTSMRLDGTEVPAMAINLIVTERVANYILSGSSVDINKYITVAAAGNLKFKPVTIPGTTAHISTHLNTQRVRVRNVVAMIEGENTNEYVVVGGHMDHMGMENGRVWNGADDNASGSVGVIMIAKAIAATGVKPKKTIIFCTWTGEEKGLLGSEYFTRNPTIGKISDVKFYLNYDMIGRDVATDTLKNKAGMTFTSTYPKLEEWTRTNAQKYNINLDINYRGNPAPTGGSDYSAFTRNQIPVIAWMAAMHPDYHQPSDHVNLINWEKMQSILRLGFLQVWEAANSDLK